LTRQLRDEARHALMGLKIGFARALVESELENGSTDMTNARVFCAPNFQPDASPMKSLG
jgi:hypothetical protein